MIKKLQPLLPIAILVAIVCSTILLTGCAGFMRHLGYQKIPKTHYHPCDNAYALLTNLTQEPNKRLYLLPNSQVCNRQITAKEFHCVN